MKDLLKWVVFITTILIFLYAFSSSYNSQNIDHLDYVIALCVDTVPDSDNLKVSFEFADLKSFSENSSSNSSEPIINTIVAPSISNAINVMNGYIGKQLNLSHCKLIVFSKDFAKRGVFNEVSVLANNVQIRPTASIVVSDMDASEYVKKSVSTLEQVLTKYYDLFPTSSKYTGYTSNIPLGKFYESIQEGDIGAVTILGKEVKNIKENTQSSSSGEGQDTASSSDKQSSGDQNSSSKPEEQCDDKRVEPNEIPKEVVEETSSENKPNYQSINPQFSIIEGDHGTENMGLTVFKDDKYVGDLTTIETLCYSLLEDEVDNFLVTLPSPFEDNQKIDIYAGSLSQLDVDVDISSDVPKVNIYLNLTADVLSVLRHTNMSYEDSLEKINTCFKNYLSKEIKDFLYKTSRKYKVDINEFYMIAKRKFWTIQDYQNYNWPEKYEKAEFNVNFNDTVITTLIIKD